MFWIFFRFGAFTIGGGYAMLPLIEQEMVDKQHWVDRSEIIDVFAVAQSIPGVIAINSSMFVGYKLAGLVGAFVAALGVILPSFITILIIGYFMIGFKDNPYLSKAFTGVRAGVTGMIALSAINLGRSVIINKTCLYIALIAFIGIAFLNIHAIWAIVGGALAGIISTMITRKD